MVCWTPLPLVIDDFPRYKPPWLARGFPGMDFPWVSWLSHTARITGPDLGFLVACAACAQVGWNCTSLVRKPKDASGNADLLCNNTSLYMHTHTCTHTLHTHTYTHTYIYIYDFFLCFALLFCSFLFFLFLSFFRSFVLSFCLSFFISFFRSFFLSLFIDWYLLIFIDI